LIDDNVSWTGDGEAGVTGNRYIASSSTGGTCIFS